MDNDLRDAVKKLYELVERKRKENERQHKLLEENTDSFLYGIVIGKEEAFEEVIEEIERIQRNFLF